MSGWSLAIAIAAFAVSVVNAIFTFENHKRQNRAEERTLEQDRPEFELEIRQHPGRDIAYIIVRNIGPGPAMKLRGHLRADQAHHFGMEGGAVGPVRPNQTFAFHVDNLVFPKEGGRPMKLSEEGERDVILEWEDRRGKAFTQVFTQAEVLGKEPVEDNKPPATWDSAYRGREMN